MIQIQTADGPAEAFLARPGDGAEHPGVLLFADAFGVRPQIEAMAERIAGWGYVVVAPNLFHRSGSIAQVAPQADMRAPGEREKAFEMVRPRMQSLTTDRTDADTTAYLDALLAQPGVADGPVGVTGYCMGARLSTRAAGLHPERVAAAGGFHGGRLVTDQPDSPHLTLASARAEFVFGHADNDASMPPEAVAALGQTLTAHGLTASNQIYPGSPHGYTMADTSMYDEQGARRHYEELRALLDRVLLS
jgi:carboxymethylenebutenolidase